MALVALVVSVVAIIVAGFSAWYTRTQSKAMAAMAAIDAKRHLRERAPTFEGRIEALNADGSSYLLKLTLTSNEPVDSVAAHLPERAGIRFTHSQSGVQPGSDGLDAVSYDEGGLAPGDQTCWRVELNPERHSEEVPVRVMSRHDDAKWTTQVAVRPPYTGPLAF